MTEAEWLSTTDAHALRNRCGPGTTRKARLYAVACLRVGADEGWGAPERYHRALDVVERYADDPGTEQELRDHYTALKSEILARPHGNPWDALLVLLDPRIPAGIITMNAAGHAAEFWGRRAFPADLLREIIGNPFRAVAFSPEWCTDTAMSLAKQMYESREFGAMPILADALQDAGCDSDDLLSHLREPHATHVRGCWALDLVLGKG